MSVTGIVVLGRYQVKIGRCQMHSDGFTRYEAAAFGWYLDRKGGLDCCGQLIRIIHSSRPG
jgi:hypothetical protein